MALPNSQPLYDIDEVVYIRASAAGRGFLEAVRIDGTQFDRTSSSWVYKINVARGPDPNIGVGDAIRLTKERILYFIESELIDLCTALSLAKSYHESQLAIINSQIGTYDCGTG